MKEERSKPLCTLRELGTGYTLLGVIYQEQSQKEDELVMLRNGYG